METIRKYGQKPFKIGLLHGGPGASGEMKTVAENLSGDYGVLEFLQTEKSVNGQIEELLRQITSYADFPNQRKEAERLISVMDSVKLDNNILKVKYLSKSSIPHSC